jgi:hypothetical protein
MGKVNPGAASGLRATSTATARKGFRLLTQRLPTPKVKDSKWI